MASATAASDGAEPSTGTRIFLKSDMMAVLSLCLNSAPLSRSRRRRVLRSDVLVLELLSQCAEQMARGDRRDASAEDRIERGADHAERRFVGAVEHERACAVVLVCFDDDEAGESGERTPAFRG